MRAYYVYIISNSNGAYYTGVTKDLQERLARHNRGRGSKFTASKGLFCLVYYETVADLKSAMQREKQIKGYSRVKKKNLIDGFRFS
jgi:putative endonuclease